MLLSSREIWRTLRALEKWRREDRLKKIVISAIDECNNSKRQAERLARWEHRLIQTERRMILKTAARGHHGPAS